MRRKGGGGGGGGGGGKGGGRRRGGSVVGVEMSARVFARSSLSLDPHRSQE